MCDVQGQGGEVCLRTQALFADTENLSVGSFLVLEEEDLALVNMQEGRQSAGNGGQELYSR